MRAEFVCTLTMICVMLYYFPSNMQVSSDDVTGNCAGTCDNCLRKQSGQCESADMSAVAREVVEGVQHLNGRDMRADLEAAIAIIQV